MQNILDPDWILRIAIHYETDCSRRFTFSLVYCITNTSKKSTFDQICYFYFKPLSIAMSKFTKTINYVWWSILFASGNNTMSLFIQYQLNLVTTTYLFTLTFDLQFTKICYAFLLFMRQASFSSLEYMLTELFRHSHQKNRCEDKEIYLLWPLTSNLLKYALAS